MKRNGVGITGFIFACLAIIFCWVPWLNWILWAIGAIVSIVGVTRTPRGFAIAGLIISCCGLIIVATMMTMGII